jgi:putative peptide zinc metalloprotease protein
MTDIITRGDEQVLDEGARWTRAPGLELLGPTQGSGLREPVFLVRRADDQMLQVSELLHLVLTHVDPGLPPAEVADRVSHAYGRTLTAGGLEHLLTARLEPLGLVAREDAEPSTTPAPRANPLLALTVKGTLVPASVTRRLARILEPAYWPPVVAYVIVAAVTLDVVAAVRGDFWSALVELFTTPTLVLAMYGLLTLAAVIHEIGHATACRYGGAEPGEIGFGIYIVFPAFYTDVTDSYRLGRGARVRTDLGGLYFNLLCIIALALTYLATGSGLVLLTGLVLHIQMLQQLIPVVRFDGYYVLADAAGVPDLFARVGPVLRSLRPGTPRDPRVDELQPRARKLVVGWVLLVVPLLAFVVLFLLWSLPEIIDQAATGIELQQWAFDAAWDRGDVASMALATLSVTLIVLPLVGVAVVLWRLGVLLGSLLARRFRGAAKHKETSMSTRTEPVSGLDAVGGPSPDHLPALSAADFTDARMLPARPAVPTQGWRRAVHRASGRTLNPGPGPAEVRRAELEARLRAPFDAARHVVVMSRKGGVGKTTMTMALGSTFALLRGDRVIAVDANPDAGNLAHRVAHPNDRNITDVLHDLDDIETYPQLRAYTAQARESRLEVLGSDDDPRIGMALDRTDYHRLIGLLDRFYNLILLDTGTGILDSANQGLLTEADQVVLVLRPGVDAGRAAALTLDWMDEHGFGRLVSQAVVVINGVRRDGDAMTDRMRRHFVKRCERVVSVPWDSELEAGARTDLSSLRRATRDAIMEAAASVADNFSEAGGRR